MNVLLVVGTRPEAIKLAPVYFALARSRRHQIKVCATAQHREMLDQVLQLFEIHPDYDLNLMRADQSLHDLTAATLKELAPLLDRDRPDLVVVQGDTTTAFAAALAAFYLRVPVAHVEAGLRTGDRLQPFPEEINRQMCDILATFLFAPTLRAQENLLREGHPSDRIFVTGNTAVDALLFIAKRVEKQSSPPGVPGALAATLSGLVNEAKRVVLVTGHRRESFGEGLQQIALALKTLAQRNPGLHIIYPVHLNPNVQTNVRTILDDAPRVHLLPPLPYDAFVWLMQRSYMILTDSGGIQEEAPSLGKPVLVMRNKTERPEAVEAGTARLVGTRCETIVGAAQVLLDDPAEHARMVLRHNPFGDGRAAERIVQILEREMEKR